MQARAFSVLLFILATVAAFLTASASSTDDAIGLGSSISGNQTLVSAGKIFQLGFFSPDGADGRTYLGIWYASIPERTVVWVANRESPVVNLPGTLELSAADGRLAIVDAKNATVWSSSAAPATTTTTTSRATAARLLDSGNLVVLSSDGKSVAWQSFDYPTDTLLPGMKLGVDIRAGLTRNITSWRSPSDPAPGEYTFKLVIGGLPQFFLVRGAGPAPGTRVYTSGPWNGDILTGVPNLKSRDLTFEVVASRDETYYRYSIRDRSLLSRFVIDGGTGKLRRYQWDNGRWSSFWFYPSEPCEEYARCGAFGYCDSDRSPMMCSCLPGFAPRSPDQWRRRDASGGCVRRLDLSCGGDGGDDGFWVVDRMKLPEATNATVFAGMTLDQCRQVCLNDCSCRAYAAANYSGRAGHGCVIWPVDLLDMRQYSIHVQDVYIRLARSEIDALKAAVDRRRPSTTTVIAVAATIAGVLLLLAVVLCCFWRNKVRRRKPQSETVSAAAPTGGARKKRLDADWKCTEKDGDLPLIDLEAIQDATNNFSVENKIGQGGFGPVYKGKLEDGLQVAVKRMSQKSSQGVEEFTNEVKVIAKLQHRNLVRLLGCCIDDDERILVYEFMDNGSLDSFIFDEGKRKLLGWKKRFEIIMGIARGLLYLHEDSRFRIIHRDMKASNVLLDGYMVPKISDFGTARMCGGDETSVNTLKIIGTYGYMSPEYAMDGLFSLKSDVYSFGVLVIEIVTGKKNRGFYDPDQDLSLLGYAWMLWKEGRTVDLADEAMGGDFSTSEVRRCIQVALLCVDVLARNRPLMSSAVMMLASENAMIPEPNEPGVNIGRNTSDTESTHGFTSNNATTTTSELDPIASNSTR